MLGQFVVVADPMHLLAATATSLTGVALSLMPSFTKELCPFEELGRLKFGYTSGP